VAVPLVLISAEEIAILATMAETGIRVPLAVTSLALLVLVVDQRIPKLVPCVGMEPLLILVLREVTRPVLLAWVWTSTTLKPVHCVVMEARRSSVQEALISQEAVVPALLLSIPKLVKLVGMEGVLTCVMPVVSKSAQHVLELRLQTPRHVRPVATVEVLINVPLVVIR